MSIGYFLILSIVFLFIIFIFAVVERTNFLQRGRGHYNLLNSKDSVGLWLRGVYLLIFSVFLSAAVSTIKTYLYPLNERMFRNVDYHVLSHKGYVIGEEFYLANGLTWDSKGHPEESLWDDKDGMLLIDGEDSVFVVKEYFDPLYIRKDSCSSYHLVNQVILEDVSEGFVLTLNNDTLYTLKIESDDEKCLYISTVYNSDHSSVSDTSTFKTILRQGYPILDIIARSPRLEMSEKMKSWFEGAYLVRTEIPMKGNTPVFDKGPAPLCLMPGSSFYLNDSLKINGATYDFKKTFRVPFSAFVNKGKVTFFSGLGKRKGPGCSLSYLPEKKMRLEFLMPDMRQIKDSVGRVFICSSIEDISKESLSGGYLYNNFVNEDNSNHIRAHFQYVIGDARSEFAVRIFDLNNKENQALDYKCNNEFLLHSDGNKNSHGASWIFEVTDLRETNELSYSRILFFIFLMFLGVAVRVLSDYWFTRCTLSLTELGIYVVLFSLCVVRLILGWRASTFVPVENISLPMYLKMRTSILDEFMWLVACMPLLVVNCVSVWKCCMDASCSRRVSSEAWLCLFASIVAAVMIFLCIGQIPWIVIIILCLPFCLWEIWHRLHRVLSKYLGKILSESRVNPFVICLIGFILVLAVCYFVRGMPLLNRLCNIPIPIVSYFIYEILINHLGKQENKKATIYIVWAVLFLLAYLFEADAGFIIIFVAYLVLRYLVLDSFYWKIKSNIWQKYGKYIFSLLLSLILFFILYYEGVIMIFCFQHVGLLLLICGVLLFVYIVFYLINHKQYLINHKQYLKGIALLLALLVSLRMFIVGLLEVFGGTSVVSEAVNHKRHMRYRAEIQSLSGDQKIDDLIQQCEFNSEDVLYIMRSAHNQWFINQYIRAGQMMKEKGECFRLQPHSNQGATFTTQTTDLVVTRYLLAEHGEGVVRYILFLWLFLILLCVVEFKMSEGNNRIFLSALILLYVISLMVYLSATNRIVFVGQDLPIISLQSKVAIVFPMLLLLLLLSRCLYLRNRETNRDSGDNVGKMGNVFACVFIFVLFSVSCLFFIEQKGKDQNDEQFDVSRLIADLSVKVDDINDCFGDFQEYEGDKYNLGRKKIKEVWEIYVNEANVYNKVYYEYLNPEIPNFFSSLLHYFNEEQSVMTDVNELLHLRRKGGRCYLTLNKQYYSVPAIMREESRWTGNIFAANVVPEIVLFEYGNKTIKINNSISDFEKNIWDSTYRWQIPNMPLMWFDENWTPGGNPLYLISSKQGQDYAAFFCIRSDSLEIKSNGSDNQIATAIVPGDVLSLYTKDRSQKNAKLLFNAGMRHDGIPYLVRNMWLNGKRRLFFPLGKQSMWTYHFGNMVSDVFSKENSLRDTSLCLSIDYDLSKAFYSSIKKKVGDKTPAVLEVINDFRMKTEVQQQDSRNNFYYDSQDGKIVVKAGTDKSLIEAAKLINEKLKEYEHVEKPLSKSLDFVMQTKYDFTAVAIDGDGQIRALFDYSRNRHLDPNNIDYMSKLISELYTDGSNAEERDIFGSKALQYIPVGPGSSFKPIAYTAITSQEKLAWESIDVRDIGMNDALSMQNDQTPSGSHKYEYYGGVQLKNPEELLNIDGNGNVLHNDYLVQSNNLYHSVVMLLGMQRNGYVEKIMRPYTPDIQRKEAFPVFTYGEKFMCFDPKEWYENKFPFIDDHDLLTEGLYKNFCIMETAPRLSDSYNYLFGDNELIKYMYDSDNLSSVWVFPETGSLNNADRNVLPLRNGFNQTFLGAAPLQQTPLQMAVNASRLASLNRARSVVSIIDGDRSKGYEFFDVGSSEGWTEQSFLDFMKRQVWAQLRAVPKRGTARSLNGLAVEMERGQYGKPYYLYCKTGTLNIDRRGKETDNRVKHLLVIITDRPLERINSVDELQKVRYYTLYLSFLGIDKNDISNLEFRPFIVNVLNSNSFKNYMTKN